MILFATSVAFTATDLVVLVILIVPPPNYAVLAFGTPSARSLLLGTTLPLLIWLFRRGRHRRPYLRHQTH